MPNTPEVIITLNCLPLGGGSMNVSPIEMDKTETVGTLKELIKSNFPIAFRDVDADDLVLWEAPESLFCNNNAFKETIEGLNLQDEKRLQLYKLFKNPTPSPYHKKLINVTRAGLGEPLQNTDHLSELFVAPLAKGRIHIIVDTPYPEICCWLRGDEVENSFGIHISANARISLLAEQIKVAKSDPRAVVDKRIRLYKVSADDDDELRETLHSPGTGHLLDGRRLISTSFLDVPVLQDYYIIVEFATGTRSGVDEISAAIGSIDNMTIYVTNQGSFSIQDLAIPQNLITRRVDFEGDRPKVSSIDSCPAFVTEFVRSIKEKRKINRQRKDTYMGFKQQLSPAIFAQHFDEVEGVGDVEDAEIRAYLAALNDCVPNIQTVNKKSSYFKECHFTAFLVDPALRSVESYDKGVGCVPSILVQQFQSAEDPRTYQPKSDFAIQTSYCPVVINETISPKNESDRIRMLLRAAAYVRVGNALRTEGKPSVLLCFYLNNRFEAERYLVFQACKSRREVEIVHDRCFILSQPQEAFCFLFEFFNYSTRLPGILEGFDESKAGVAARISTVAKGMYNLSLSSKDSQNDCKTSKQTTNGSSNLDTIQEHVDLLTGRGYMLRKIFERHHHVAIATSIDSGQRIILKVTSREREVEILRYLNSENLLADPRNHTIPLLDIMPIDQRPGVCVLAFPAFLPLPELPHDSMTPAQCYRLIEQVLEAFSFLHEHNIAHLDIKDRNIVIDTATKQMYVIDFDLSRRVGGVEERIDGYRGTEDWVAPEVGNCSYSAIRADLWAVGQLIEHIFVLFHYRTPTTSPYAKHLREVGKCLRNDPPLDRPMLRDVLHTIDLHRSSSASGDRLVL